MCECDGGMKRERGRGRERKRSFVMFNIRRRRRRRKKTELHFSLICGGAVDVHDHQCRRCDGRAISRKTDELRLSHFSNFSATEKAKHVFCFEIFSSDFKLRRRVVKYYFRVAHGQGVDS